MAAPLDAASRSIYIEDQALPVPEVAIRLEEALKRGLGVVMLVPAEPEEHVRTTRQNASRRDLFDRIEVLGRCENSALVGIAASYGQGQRSNIYVHSKIMLVDDQWATVGFCNLHSNSLSGHRR